MLSRPHPTLALRQSLDSAPGLPDTYDGEDTPSRSESRASRAGLVLLRMCGGGHQCPPWGNGQLRYDHGRIASSCSQRQTATTAVYGWAKTLEKSPVFIEELVMISGTRHDFLNFKGTVRQPSSVPETRVRAGEKSYCRRR